MTIHYEQLQQHLTAICAAAREGSSRERIEIARELIELSSEILTYGERESVSLDAQNDPNARLDADRVISFRRKAAILRSILEGSNIATVAASLQKVRQTVHINLQEMIRILRKRTRNSAKFMGKDDPLEGMSDRITEFRLEERTAYLDALTRYDKELDRREKGLPWADVWY